MWVQLAYILLLAYQVKANLQKSESGILALISWQLPSILGVLSLSMHSFAYSRYFLLRLPEGLQYPNLQLLFLHVIAPSM